ncbi:adenylate/guanylate cyclase domain-containing protein [Nocardioides marmoribigeumensis]|uniref:Class 3 adenylate cyclase n=1 Tax=Nocardioides marmoribigeumensis TaxID=433649 RepID=A0ABU2BYP6_9ACTN|nr:adenylate/guanylate cyclase domain-containing protein [Nocardioides marmoribigeumensis]MDR7363532.1 class 3 adenylate cyclase [Nocardioides marmoribigeumensis]
MDTWTVSLAASQSVTAIALLAAVRALRLERRAHEELRSSMDTPAARATHAAGWAMRRMVDTASRVRQRGLYGGLVTASIEDLTDWAMADREEIVRVAAPDGTVTLMFTDIEDSTPLNEELGDADFVKLLGAHARVVTNQVRKHRGHVVKTQGDGFMMAFGSPSDAVDAAMAIQAETAGSARRRRTPVRVRVGIHEGPAIARDGDYFGRAVAIAARVAAGAEGGQVLVTTPVVDALQEYAVESCGEFELRGLGGVHEIWAVRA